MKVRTKTAFPQVFHWTRNVRVRDEDDNVVTWASWQWRVSVRCDVWQGTRSRWSPHYWQCPRDILLVSSNCQEFWDNTKPSVRLIKISFFSDLDTFSSSFLTGGRLAKSFINIFRWPADVHWIQTLNEQIFSMPILSASLLSAKNSPEDGEHWSGNVGIVAHLIIETQGPHPELVSCHEDDNGWRRPETGRHQYHLALHCHAGTITSSVSISDAVRMQSSCDNEPVLKSFEKA